MFATPWRALSCVGPRSQAGKRGHGEVGWAVPAPGEQGLVAEAPGNWTVTCCVPAWQTRGDFL